MRRIGGIFAALTLTFAVACGAAEPGAPDVTGLPYNEAVQQLEDAGIEHKAVGTRGERLGLQPTMDTWHVVSQEINDGQLVLTMERHEANSAMATTTVAPTTTETPEPVSYRLGEEAVSGGVILTVMGVSETDSIMYQQSNRRGDYTPYAPPNGGKFVVVETHIFNDGLVSKDLTCGYPIDHALFTADQRQYDPIRRLHRVADNPECNVSLQPGFSTDMTYVYEVPVNSEPTMFAFADMETLRRGEFTYVTLSQ